MYELKLSKVQKQKFVNVARYRLAERKKTFKDLAEEINRPVNSVYCFFNNNQRTNRFIAAEIARALEMKQEDWRV